MAASHSLTILSFTARTFMISVAEALKAIIDNATTLPSRTIAIEQAHSFVLVNNITADRPLPPFDRVAMDGFAVRSSDFTGPDLELKLKGCIQTGIQSEVVVGPGEAVQIMTGAPCPKGADAVVKVESSQILGDTVRLHEEKMKPGLNIAPKGEDTAQGDVLIKAGTALTTTGIAICASVGCSEVEVYRKPRVKIISTGTEIIPPSQQPLPYQIRDCNSYTLRSMCGGYALENEFLGIGEDDPAVLGALIQAGLDSEILILSGGVSMGEFDHIPGLLSANGVRSIFHHVKVKPGKPIWFGKSDRGTFVFGLPGNPVSVQTCFRIFVEPLIKKLSGYQEPHHAFLKLPLREDTSSKTPREHYMPGELVSSGATTMVKPVFIRGSGDFTNFEKSQGLFIVPAEKRWVKAGEMVEFLPWRELW
jgi:molybdopterin molybdotransferase